MQLYKHKNYDEYKKAQEVKNKRKLSNIWAEEPEISGVCRYVRNHVPNLKLALCHGVRNGWEVQAFREGLGIEVIGTEISSTATKFPNVIQWDFHEVKDEWIGSVDFIYSNSLDHSYKPQECVQQWLKCLSPDGLCIIQWTHAQSEFPLNKPDKADPGDCFRASGGEYKAMFSKIATVKDILKSEDILNETVDKFGVNPRWFVLSNG